MLSAQLTYLLQAAQNVYFFEAFVLLPLLLELFCMNSDSSFSRLFF